MSGTVQFWPRQIRCSDLVSHRHPACRATTWMTSDVRPLLSTGEVHGHSDHRLSLDGEIQRVRHTQRPIRDDDRLITTTERDGLQS